MSTGTPLAMATAAAIPPHLEFAPPPPPGRWPSIGLALLAHALLVAALTWGVGWKREATVPVFDVEIVSAVRQEAAPRAVEVAPPPPAPKTQPEPPPQRPAEIAVQKDKPPKAEPQRRDNEDKRKADAQRQQQEARRQAEQEKELARQREENLRRLAGMAGASGAPTATGSAQQSSGPSANYAGRIMARIKPNIVFPERDSLPGNPATEVVVRLAPDGTIIARRIVKSSGIKAWDDAVLRALDRTEVLPRDTDGRVVPEFPITFRPKDN